ncbi:hypothetical protein U5640_01175 [Streptomyces sp. SS7]|uniref:hypothetical protein n=1 Tax=Streptomyces sp. SS7 TaxID=3108485 RepID=UPI0030ED2223
MHQGDPRSRAAGTARGRSVGVHEVDEHWMYVPPVPHTFARPLGSTDDSDVTA